MMQRISRRRHLKINIKSQSDNEDLDDSDDKERSNQRNRQQITKICTKQLKEHKTITQRKPKWTKINLV